MKMVGALFTVAFLMIVSIPFAAAEDAPKPPPAPVELDGKLLFTIQAGTRAFTPELRATQIAARIKELAADYTFRPETITTGDLEFATEISGDERFIMAVFDADARAEGTDRNALAKAYVIKIQRAIEAYRAERSITRIVTGIVLTLVSTVVLAALIYLLNRSVRKIRQTIQETNCRFRPGRRLSLHSRLGILCLQWSLGEMQRTEVERQLGILMKGNEKRHEQK